MFMPKLSRREFLAAAALPALAQPPSAVYVVPNFHPASCGWLTNFSKERVYCANSYFDHLDRVRDDPNYAFVLSEVNNMIAMMNFHPERTGELKARIKEGRVELVNAFFLESTINLSGGEALVRLGLEGLRWQQKVLGVRPRFAWCIDVCGTHAQMAQITAGLGLDALVYCRKNPTGSTLHWAESPDGSRTLAISPGHYSELRELMAAKDPLTAKQLGAMETYFAQKQKITPAGAPVLVLAGSGDYSLAPARKENPSEFLRLWTGRPIRFSTLGKYVDAVKKVKLDLPTMRGGTVYDFHSFWIQNPRVKTWYRKCEHLLRDAEMLATAASLRGKFSYPAGELQKAWVQMFLNMDRNTLWGAAGGMVFENEKSWDARDRFQAAERIATQTIAGASAALGMKPTAPLQAAKPIMLPEVIETRFYRARIDKVTGAIASLQSKRSEREMLAGGANALVAERPNKQSGDPGDHMAFRADRKRVATSGDAPVRITASEDESAIVVEIAGQLFGPCRRTIRFVKDAPRIEFETELNDIPDRTVIVSEFPLNGPVVKTRRGIPYGFEEDPVGIGIVPAVRWSHYELESDGVALLDRGLSGRELTGSTPVIFLLNASEKYYGYPNSWLSGMGKHVLHYAMAVHEGKWPEAAIAKAGWEFNAPALRTPFVEASANVLLESMRRTGGFIEVRVVECLGIAGEASLRLDLPHRGAAMTDLTGANAMPLKGGPIYRFPVRAQQIVTLRFRTSGTVPEPEPVMRWDELAPEQKRAALHEYSNDKGHPPRGDK
jgi:hypothetical protein